MVVYTREEVTPVDNWSTVHSARIVGHYLRRSNSQHQIYNTDLKGYTWEFHSRRKKCFQILNVRSNKETPGKLGPPESVGETGVNEA